MSLFTAAREQLPKVKDSDGNIITEEFLGLCRLTLPVIDQFGAGFSLVRSDISGNIERLATRAATDPARFQLLYPIVEDELARNDHDHSRSCTKGLLWLKRAMEFMVAILRGLLDRPADTLSDVVYETYYATLHTWHGFLASSAFRVAFNFVPHREPFLVAVAGAADEAALADMAAFCAAFSPLLGEVHAWLDQHGLDDPAKV